MGTLSYSLCSCHYVKWLRCYVVWYLCYVVLSLRDVVSSLFMSSCPHLRYQALVPRLIRYHELVRPVLDRSQFPLFSGVEDSKMVGTDNSD